MGSLDSRSPTKETIDLPIIDVSDTSPANASRLIDAAIQYGFLYVSPTNTPFSESLIDAQFALSHRFFASSLPEKQRYQVKNDNRGWLGMHAEILDPAKQSREFKEALNIGEFDERDQPRQTLPEYLGRGEGLGQLQAFQSACETTCRMILDLMGIGLEVEGEGEGEGGREWFSSRHGRSSGCTVRMLHYPSLPEGTEYSMDEDVRAGAHSDYGSITLLFQRPSQPGLEIRPSADTDEWSPVAVFPPNYPSTTLPPILVNIGDLMSYWTNGLLRSTVHRVIFPKDTRAGQSRYSLVYFCHPKDDVELVPVPSRMVRQQKEKLLQVNKDGDELIYGYGGGMDGQRAMTAKEHLVKRLDATYSHRTQKLN